MDFVHCRKKKEKKNIIKIQSGLLEENLPQQNWAQSLHALCFTAFAANGTRPRTASRRDLALTWNNKTELFPQQTCWLLGAGGKRRCNINDGSLPVRWPSKPCQWASMDINEALALAQLKRNAAIINVSCYTCVCHDRIPRQEEGLWLEMFSCIRSVFYWNIQDIFPYVYQRVLYILYLFEVKTSATHSIKKKKPDNKAVSLRPFLLSPCVFEVGAVVPETSTLPQQCLCLCLPNLFHWMHACRSLSPI